MLKIGDLTQRNKNYVLIAVSLLCFVVAFGIFHSYQTTSEHKKGLTKSQRDVRDAMMNPAYQVSQRIENKKRELDKLHITGKERDRLFNQERNAAIAEYNRVAASGFKKPYDMNSR